MIVSSKNTASKKLSLLVFFSSYSWTDIKSKKLESLIDAFDAGRFFSNKIYVNVSAYFVKLDKSPFDFGYPEKIVYKSDTIVYQLKAGRFYSLRKFQKFNFALSFFSLIKILILHHAGNKIGIVRTEDPNLNGIFGFLFARMFRAPLIVGIWGNPQLIRRNLNRPLVPKLFKTTAREESVEKLVLKGAARIMLQNRANCIYPLSLGLNPDKFFILPLSLSIDSIHYVEPRYRVGGLFESDLLDLDKNSFNLICLSRLEKLKYVEDLVEVMMVLREKNSSFHLYFVGDGSLKNTLELLIFDKNLSNSISFLGEKDQVWLGRNLPRFDLALAPLWGRALLEVALAGCPVVAYNIDWHSELVIEMETGFLVPIGDVGAMADKAKLIAENPTLKKKFSSGIRERGLSYSNRTHAIDSLRCFYDEVSRGKN